MLIWDKQRFILFLGKMLHSLFYNNEPFFFLKQEAIPLFRPQIKHICLLLSQTESKQNAIITQLVSAWSRVLTHNK